MREHPRVSVGLRALEVWLLISVVETLHGTARVKFLQPVLGDLPARQVAVFTGSLLIVAIAIWFRKWMGISSGCGAFASGAGWVGLTVAFEVILGRFVMQLSWARILEDYDLTHGGLMLVGLLVMFVAPYVAYRYGKYPARSLTPDGHRIS